MYYCIPPPSTSSRIRLTLLSLPAADCLSLSTRGIVTLTLAADSLDSLTAQRLFERALTLLKRSHQPKLLLDLRAVTSCEPALLSWVVVNWGPRAITSGYLRQVAVLPSVTPGLRLQATQLFLHAQQHYGLISRFFCTQPPDAALTWLG